jgi:predicted ATP-grasp superfamily ATP-dependent carboligase
MSPSAPTLEELAEAYIRGKTAAAETTRIGKALMKGMAEQARGGVEVRGLGSVTFVPETSRTTFDAKAAAVRITELVAQLRELGAQVDEAQPIAVTKIAASLKIVVAPGARHPCVDPGLDP